MGFSKIEEVSRSHFNQKEIKSHKKGNYSKFSMMIQRMIQKKEKNYYNCVIEKVGDAHFLRKFE